MRSTKYSGVSKSGIIKRDSEGMIEHLVLSGSGPHVFTQLGACSMLDLSHIKSIWGVSGGGLLAAALGLKLGVDLVEKFVVGTKCKDILDRHCTNNANTMGMVRSSWVIEFLSPLFEKAGLSPEITMLDYWELTQVELHIIAMQCLPVKKVDLNHVDFPDLPVLTAVQMTICIPFVFTPVEYKSAWYVDGGLLEYCPTCSYVDHVAIVHVLISPTDDTQTWFERLAGNAMRALSAVTTPPVTRHPLYVIMPATTTTYVELWQRSVFDPTFRHSLVQEGKQLMQRMVQPQDGGCLGVNERVCGSPRG